MRKLLLFGLIFSFIASIAFAEESASVAAVETKQEEVKAEGSAALPEVPSEEKITGTEATKEQSDQKKEGQVTSTEEIQKSEEAKDAQLLSPDKA